MGIAGNGCVQQGRLGQRKRRRAAGLYSSIPYPTLVTSTVTQEGIAELRQALQGKVSVLAGPSGAGKSSLLNALNPHFKLQTGEVSAKIHRGRHTTRQVELLACDQGYVADTPGFSQLQLEPDQEDRLQFAFPEFGRYRADCRFRGCMHRREPDCAVLEALARGEIAPTRHENYLLFLQEVAPRY